MSANPKFDVDDDIIEERDSNDGLVVLTPEWVERHLSVPLDQDCLVELRERLEEYGDEAGLQELASIERPTRFDHRRLLNIAELKFGTLSNTRLLEY